VRIQPLPRSTWPTASDLPRRRPSRPSAGPARPGPASNARLQPRADDPPSWTWRATIPAVRLPAPPPHPATSFPSDTADAGTHRHWTPDTGHLDAQTPAPDTGHMDRHPWDTGRSHWTPDTGHRMPDTNADTVTTALPASGPLGRHAQRPHAKTPNHVGALALPAGCSAAPPGSSGASAHCSPRKMVWVRVGRTATLHPL
jgi:hypothetical protein